MPGSEPRSDDVVGCHDAATPEQLAELAAMPEGYGRDRWLADHPEATEAP